jgi:hypothetical protein
MNIVKIIKNLLAACFFWTILLFLNDWNMTKEIIKSVNALKNKSPMDGMMSEAANEPGLKISLLYSMRGKLK